MTLRQDTEAISAYRQMLRELGVEVERLSDGSLIAALQRASASWAKVEDDVANLAAQVREACRGTRSRVMGAAGALGRGRPDE